jgi:hypothetical protein
MERTSVNDLRFSSHTTIGNNTLKAKSNATQPPFLAITDGSLKEKLRYGDLPKKKKIKRGC